jgi:lactate dehydrogenase-like 2-hydroxyacid dehydrogenase
MRPKVFVSQPIVEAALELLRQEADVTVYPYLDRQISVPELAAAAKNSDFLFVQTENTVTADVIYANPNLKGIGAQCSSGPAVDMKAANACKIPVFVGDPTVTLHLTTTGDLTIALLLGLAYRLVESDRYTRAGRFRQEQTMALMGVGCPGKTVGFVGLGRIGVYMAPRLLAFDMHIVYTKRNRLAPERERELGVEWTPDLDEVIKRSDFLCLLCSYNPSTHKLIGRRELDLMKKEAYFINTARGRVVDEPELVRALVEKRIAGAGLDVYWDEPPLTPDPRVPEELYKLDNVIITPHNASATWDSRIPRAVSVAKSMIQVMRGERPATLINPEIYADG